MPSKSEAGPGAAQSSETDAKAQGRIRHSAPTMRDVGRVAGVSQSVVSRVLNDAPGDVRIPQHTRERVRLAARKLGYRPNPLARGLRGAQTMLIGTVVSDITDPFFTVAIEALSVASISQGYNLVLGHAHDRLDEARTMTSVLETRHCDAIVLLGDIQDQPRLFADLAESVVPLVGLLQGSSGTDMPLVGVDNQAGMTAALKHLNELGHTRIGLVSGHRTGDIDERHGAFLDFMRDRFGGTPDGFVQFGSNTPDGGDSAARALLSQAQRPTAIMCTNDTMAIGVIHAAHALGLNVPNDLSVHGFDDMALAGHLVPELTTVRIPIDNIATEGIRRAIALATGQVIAPSERVCLFEPTLIVRESTAAPGQ